MIAGPTAGHPAAPGYRQLVEHLLELETREQHLLDAMRSGAAAQLPDFEALGELWQEAAAVRASIDASFDRLQQLQRPALPTASDRAALERLLHLHEGNLRRTAELRAAAGAELRQLGEASKVAAYAPLGSTTRAPRYLDQAA